MSVEIPTAEGPPTGPPPPSSGPPGRVIGTIVALVAVTAVAVTATRDDQPSAEEQVPAPVDPTLPMEQWELTAFPGAGVFVDVAVGPTGSVAVTAAGTDWASPDRSSHVWAADAEFVGWTWVDVARWSDAAISSVALREDMIFAAGTLHADDMTPTLWSGTAVTGLEIIDEPFPAPGRLHLIRNLDDQLVVVGELFDPSSASSEPIVLRGSPGEWTEITPEGATEVHEVITTGPEWIAVGMAEGRRPAIWHSQDRGATWTERPVMADPAVTVTDVTQIESTLYAIAQIRPASAPTSLLLRSDAGSWIPVGEPRTLNIHWLASIGRDLIGGPGPPSSGAPSAPFLWRHDGGGRWTTVAMRHSVGRGDFPTTFAAASDGIVAGSVIGQPALWMPPGDAIPVISTSPNTRQWERVAVLPPDGGSFQVLPDGRMVTMVWPAGVNEAPAMQIMISEDGTNWQRLWLLPDFEYGSIHSVGGRMVLVAVAGSTMVVASIDDNEFVELAEVEANQWVGIDTEEEALILYVRVANSTSRIVVPIEPSAPVTTEELPWNPLFIHDFDDGLIVGGGSETMVWPADTLQVSTDRGESWTELDVEPWAVVGLGPDVIVIGGPDQDLYQLALDPVGLEPLELPDGMVAVRDGWRLTGWGGGLAAFDPAGRVLLLPEPGSEVVTIELSPVTGFDGILMFPAEGNHIVASEGGERVVYRWTGDVP